MWATMGLDDTFSAADDDDGKAQLDATSPPKEAAEIGHGRDVKSWFFSARTSFGSNGWERLVGEEIECYKTEADHLSMVMLPDVSFFLLLFLLLFLFPFVSWSYDSSSFACGTFVRGLSGWLTFARAFVGQGCWKSAWGYGG